MGESTVLRNRHLVRIFVRASSPEKRAKYLPDLFSSHPVFVGFSSLLSCSRWEKSLSLLEKILLVGLLTENIKRRNLMFILFQFPCSRKVGKKSEKTFLFSCKNHGFFLDICYHLFSCLLCKRILNARKVHKKDYYSISFVLPTLWNHHVGEPPWLVFNTPMCCQTTSCNRKKVRNSSCLHNHRYHEICILCQICDSVFVTITTIIAYYYGPGGMVLQFRHVCQKYTLGLVPFILKGEVVP